MRNPNRTTKPERRAARRQCPTICRAVGTATAARLRRMGLTDDSTGFDRLLLALDLPPGTIGDGAGMHWSEYRNMAKTEDGRVVYIDPADYARGVQEISEALMPILDARLDAEIEAAGLDPADYAVSWVTPEQTSQARADAEDRRAAPMPAEFGSVTEVRADAPELPEEMRPAVEAFVAGQGGELADYIVVYRPSELDTDRAEFLIYPAGTWEHGGILEDYARMYGGVESPIDLEASSTPVGAPPFNTELFQEYRQAFTEDYPQRYLTQHRSVSALAGPCGTQARFTELDAEGQPTGAVHDLPGPVTITFEHAPDTEQARAAREQLRGAGTLHMPQLLGAGLDDAARERLIDAAADACSGEPAPAPAPAMIVGHARTSCIECGHEFDGTGEVCSARCGYSLTGEYPADMIEKDYGDGADD